MAANSNEGDMVGWVNLVYESEDDDDDGFPDLLEEALDSDDLFTDEEEVSDTGDELLEFLVGDESGESESETGILAEGSSGMRLLMSAAGDVEQHGVHTSVPHHQCCDSISLADADSDSLVFTEGRFAVLYDLMERVLISAVDLGFKPYSIARHADMFAAVGTQELKIYYLRPDPKKGTRVTFQQAAGFKVGSLGAMSNMNNSVRFGRCGNEWKLLVAGQDRFVYVFNVPKAAVAKRNGDPGPSSSTGAPPTPVAEKDFLSSSLKTHYNAEQERQPGLLRWEPPSVRTTAGDDVQTDVIGRFKVALNCAAASPDGKLLAVVGDSANVWVLDHASGYSLSSMTTLSLTGRPHRTSAHQYKGCQYVAWNATSDLLAASSDTDHVVRVWRVRAAAGRRRGRTAAGDGATAEVIGTYTHRHPCLALQFSPVDPLLLYYTEAPYSVPGFSPALHVVDLRRPSDATQTLKSNGYPPNCSPAQFPAGGCSEGHVAVLQCIKADCPGYKKWQKPGGGEAPRAPPMPMGFLPVDRLLFRGTRQVQVTGLAVSRRHGVLLALHGGGEHGVKNHVLHFRPLTWTYERHRQFPPRFKDATRCILLAASTVREPTAEAGPSDEEIASGSSFRDLPKDVVYNIIEKAAMPQSAWAARSAPEAASVA